jgi:hypothetical protein
MSKPWTAARWLTALFVCALVSAEPADAQTSPQDSPERAAVGDARALTAPKADKAPVAAAELEPADEVKSSDELVTDRPDFTESSEIISRGVFQFESGLTYEGDTREGVRGRSLTIPGALLRIGLGARTELRIGADGFLSQVADTARASGFSDVELGVKIRLLNHQTAGVDVAVIPMASFPTGTSGFSSGGIDPTLKLAWARDLPAGFGATGNVNIASVSDEAGRFLQRAVSVSIGHDVFAGWGGFVETYAFTPMDRGEATGVTLDWGVSRPFGHSLQFDIEAGRGLTATAADWFVGFGFAVRGRLAGKP